MKYNQLSREQRYAIYPGLQEKKAFWVKLVAKMLNVMSLG